MVQRTGTRALKFVFADLLGDFVYFPVWWYSRGAVKVVKALVAAMRDTVTSLALGVWIKNLFVPMYGQHDFSGRLVSFFMRLFQIAIRSLAAFFWLIIRTAVFFVYLLLLPFIVWMIGSNFLQAFSV